MFKHVLGGSKLAKLAGATLAAGVIATAFHTTAPVKASDHDDGETNIKARNLNLTDLYVFREDWQTGNAEQAGNMIFIMNTNPRSLPRQQYFFNTNAVYSFFVSRRATQNDPVTGVPDIAFDFNFGTPNAGVQPITLNIRRFSNGQESTTETVQAGSTTVAAPLLGVSANTPNPTAVENAVTTANGSLAVFAGIREDPFFFDVDSYFRSRAALAGKPAPTRAGIDPRGAAIIGGGELNAGNCIDFAKGYNVNALVMRVPITLLKDGTSNGVFDVWETIAVPDAFAALQ